MLGVKALDDLQSGLLKEGTRIRADFGQRSQVRFGDNKTLITQGTVFIPWNHGGVKVEIPVGVLYDSPMPLLISRQVLKDMKLRTDFDDNKLTTPHLREHGQHLVARESCTGHILLPMTKKTWSADLHSDEGGVHVNMSEMEEPTGCERPPSDMKTSTADDGRGGTSPRTEPNRPSPE